MIHVEQKKKQNRSSFGYLISGLLIGGFLYLFLIGTQGIASKTESEQLNVLNQAIRRATIQCYAIEGRYPPSVEYLEEHYGISIDREKYYVFYDGWASNIMPDITVFPASKEEEGLSWQ